MKLFIKKALAVIVTAGTLLTLAGCGSRFDDYEVEGGDMVLSVREDFAALDSGVLSVYDTAAGDLQGEFTFMYDKKDVLRFSYKSVYDGEPYYEYYDGKSLNVQRKGEVASYKFPNRNYKKYKRGKDTHPNASGGIFFYEPACMTLKEDGKTAVVEVTENADGKIYSYVYDMEKLSGYMTTETSEGTIVSFTVDYCFNKDGSFRQMEEISVLDNGTIYSSTVKISRQNEIAEITNYIEE